MMSMVKRNEDGELPESEIIMFYHEEFVKALKMFGFMKPPPTLLDLNVELMRHGAMEVIMTIAFLPFSYVDWSKLQVEDLIGSGDPEKDFQMKMKMFEHPIVEKLLKEGLKKWVAKGFF